MRDLRIREAGLELASASGPVAVAFCSPRIVRVSFGEHRPPAASFVAPRTWTPPTVEVTEGEPVRVGTSALRLEVATDPLRLTFADGAGPWLLREPADGGRTPRAHA